MKVFFYLYNCRMKRIKLLFVFIIGMMVLPTYSQVIDSTKTIESRLLELEKNTEILQSNLTKCHNQWGYGAGVTGAGIGFSGIGTWLLIETNTNPTQKDPTVGYAMIAGGGLLQLIGTIVMLDSHKYIGKAGLSLSNGGIKYTFK